MWSFWKFTRYGWGWDIGPVFGYWLVWAREDCWLRCYVSNDATPPDDYNRGFTIMRRYVRAQ
jgi:hypothetical protein